MFFRIYTLVIKELQVLLRDKQSLIVLIMPLIMQLSLFPFAATLEVTNNSLAIFNEDSGKESIELMQRLAQAQAFNELIPIFSIKEQQSVLDQQQALMVIHFPADFSRQIQSMQSPSIKILLDGRRSNSAQVALSYIQQIIKSYSDEKSNKQGLSNKANLIIRNRYNPNLDFKYHILPSLVAMITTISSLIVTAMSVAREREQGTFDQLRVSPLTPSMIMIGKAVPAIIVAMLQASIILLAGIFIYKIPFVGSFLLLFFSMFFYILSLAGFGLLISSICTNQQQAFLGVFTFLVPAILLSGFVSPIENMPVWLQYMDWFNPLRHFIVIVKGLYLKDFQLNNVLQNLWPLCLIAVLTLTSANWMFRNRLG